MLHAKDAYLTQHEMAGSHWLFYMIQWGRLWFLKPYGYWKWNISVAQNSESKCQSKESNKDKIQAYVFLLKDKVHHVLDTQGVLLVNYLSQDSLANVDIYCKSLRNYSV